MTSKNFKFGDLGDSSMNKLVRYRLTNFELSLIYMGATDRQTNSSANLAFPYRGGLKLKI